MRVTATFNDSDLQRGINNLKSKFPNAVRRSLSRAVTTGKADMARRIQADTGLTIGRIKRDMRTILIGNFTAQVEVTGLRIPLIEFGARGPEPSRGRGRGVSYRNPGGGRARDPHAFIATMPSGHRGVFHRTTKARDPIVQLHGPSLVLVFARHREAGAETMREALMTNLRHEIEFAANR